MSEAAAEDLPLPARRDKPVTLLHALEYGLLRVLFFVFRLIGVDAASALAGGFMRVVGPLLPVNRRADDNLRMIYPEMSPAERRRIAAGVWENLGRTAAEMAHLDKFRPGEENGRVDVACAEHVRAVVRSGSPAIFVSGHFANWEIMAILLHRWGAKPAVIYRAANNPLVDEFVIRTRAAVMGRLQIPKGKRGGRALIEALRDGRSPALLVDQKLNDGIAAPFMGRDAMTAPAAARLSLKFGAPILAGRIERLKGAHFRVIVDPPIAFTPTGETAEDVRALTTLINQRLESYVRARPEQWLWLHRRWPKSVHVA
ncbi:MAG: lauroyl acyltransferase [Parvularculaceae bacterium]|nr:lauroyl acyltransferase [Parvularculaceae bacterium]